VTATVFDAQASPPAAALSHLAKGPMGPLMVINRLSPRVVDPVAGDVVTFKERTDERTTERLGRVLAVDGDELSWRVGVLRVDGESVGDLPWDRSGWRPHRQTDEGLGSYFARFSGGQATGEQDPPRSVGFGGLEVRVPRHRLYLLFGSDDGLVSAAMVPYGDVTGIAYFPQRP
jgi:hypothetical protein